jgi:hypothetical protein
MPVCASRGIVIPYVFLRISLFKSLICILRSRYQKTQVLTENSTLVRCRRGFPIAGLSGNSTKATSQGKPQTSRMVRTPDLKRMLIWAEADCSFWRFQTHTPPRGIHPDPGGGRGRQLSPRSAATKISATPQLSNGIIGFGDAVALRMKLRCATACRSRSKQEFTVHGPGTPYGPYQGLHLDLVFVVSLTGASF